MKCFTRDISQEKFSRFFFSISYYIGIFYSLYTCFLLLVFFGIVGIFYLYTLLGRKCRVCALEKCFRMKLVLNSINTTIYRSIMRGLTLLETKKVNRGKSRKRKPDFFGRCFCEKDCMVTPFRILMQPLQERKSPYTQDLHCAWNSNEGCRMACAD